MGDAPSAQALAALAAVMSLVDALLKRGMIDRTAVDVMLREAGTFAQALCADYSQEVEREVQQLVGAISKAEASGAEVPPIPLIDPA